MDKMDAIKAEIDFIIKEAEEVKTIAKSMQDIPKAERWTDRGKEFDRWLDVLGYYLYLMYISDHRIHEIRFFENEADYEKMD